MKRAAILILAIATLVLIGSPSTPLHADTSNTTRSGSGPSVVAPGGGGTVDMGGPSGSGSGGSNEGDADGLSGLRPPTTPKGASAMTYEDRVMITVKMLWRFMLWIR